MHSRLQSSADMPLCVDLDGTLIFSDTLVEFVCRAMKVAPWVLFLLPFWLLRGRAYLKNQLAKRFSQYVNKLPFNEKLIEFLQQEKSRGRKIYLTTACEETLAKKIASQLEGLFDDVFGTTQALNLKSKNKAIFLSEKFGENAFAYAGNDSADIAVWNKSAEMVFVNANNSVKKIAKKQNPQKPFVVFDKEKHSFTFLRTIRIHQWAKNVLIFVPLLLSHNFLCAEKLLHSVLAFIAFGLCASATYIINDLLDLENDRAHHKKKFRPIPAGEISIFTLLAVIIVFFAVAFLLTISISKILLAMLVMYTIATLMYSFKLKKLIIIDIILLAFLYIFRLFFGAEATNTPVSHWLATFATFIFLSLGAVKRYVEILKTKETSTTKLSGRGYSVEDASIVANIGVSSGLISILTYMIYINYGAEQLYGNPNILFLGSFPLLYFILKIWIKASRKEVNDDPIVHAIKTKENYVLFLLFVLIFIIAKPIIV